MAKNILKHYYRYLAFGEFFHSMMFVTYVLFLASHGLDNFQIMMINFVFMAGIFLFEIPTGIFADLFGRKFSLIIGRVIFSFGFLIYFISHNFWGFMIAELCAAIGATFTSGANDAWLKDNLDFHGYKGKISQVFANGEIIRNLVIVLGGLTGAYIGQTDLALPWLIAGSGSLASALYIWKFFKEDYFMKPEIKISLKELLKKAKQHTGISFGLSFKNKTVLLLIIINFGLLLAFQPANMYWSLSLKKYIDNVFVIGQVWVLIPILMIVGSYIVKWLDNKLSEKILMFISIVIISIGLSVASLFDQVLLIVIFFMTHELGRGMLNPVKRAYINDHIPSEQRATVLSFDSMVSRLGAAIGLLGFGLIGKYYSIELCWLIAGIVVGTLVFVAILLPNGQKLKQT